MSSPAAGFASTVHDKIRFPHYLMKNITSNTRVKVTSDQVSSELGKEVVILHVKNGIYYGLDEVGVLIWSKLQGGSSVSEIVSSIVQEFDVDAKTCEQDVLRILSELVDAQLVTVDSV